MNDKSTWGGSRAKSGKKPQKSLFDRASERASYSARLAPHYDTIFDESWGDDEDHLRWVLTASVNEIEGWAETVENAAK